MLWYSLTRSKLIGVFDYLWHETIAQYRIDMAQSLVREVQRGKSLNAGLYGIAINFRIAFHRHGRWIENFAQKWLADHIPAFEDSIIENRPPNSAQLLEDLEIFKGKIKEMTIPWIFSGQPPQ
jgi:hypothetical protein